MQTVIDSFNDRVKEIDRYFLLLKTLDDPAVSITAPTVRPAPTKTDVGWLRILKATVFLLLYNLVESAVREAFGALYDKIQVGGHTCEKLKEDFVKLWVEQQFRALDKFSASPKTYQETAHEIVLQIMNSTAVKMVRERLSLSGNLDAEGVRSVCQKHGISVATPANAKGGIELMNVRIQRNNLAHGLTSFEDCGRQYTVADLERVKSEVVLFVAAILNNIRSFADAGHYVK